ncbi:undecaprenyldiphospho-muramoylpentapeptide beta-N-acetylglucosaminyltransferase [Psychroflexus planctonicus]|uniref:UDP-N-acetylglucosamine--N-acetylmuramyl-(pentapeptide) pyrophosphoryl-undecaprenol N-acetylglucosamine transferase n=1 Tax=Psychroflexus planctonicus TaxID=1526575 RepID=A0ABQ1SJT6_9FLAO|nr:undecaprenyldiphospho-muramoylpentapeptide beta-N-acetylglucosaminyltransferase [Psychroflexus planctonicus]GGE39725.1 UDP-N-acetylglucosamine--N-acetylmuramyl-(pentapeptide) pyrophosphoryl-undecaprenol N-acetylglucosamine transferase [Psychroflexus planctonicus]
MKNLKVLISGGGTGGHIFPAIAIAQEIQHRYPTAEILFVGAKDRMEMQKVPQAGFKIEGLWISGIQRKLTLSNLMFPFKLMSSLIKARKIIRNFKPDIAIGTGGFASGPLLKAATQKEIPSLIQEQNSYAGITNKWVAQKVDRICVAYPNMERYFPKEKIVFTGNPIRRDVLQLSGNASEAKANFGFNANQKVLLIIGGSLGAKRINELISAKLEFFKAQNIQVLWQTGKFYYENYKNLNSEGIRVVEFIQEMNQAYTAADFIISRAGAGSVSELCVVGKPVIFIPSPNVAEDHQTKNANSIVAENAAISIAEQDLEEAFQNTFLKLLQDESRQKELSANIKKLAKPEATSDIVNEVEKIIAAQK